LSKIEAALSEVCGGRVAIVLTTHDDPAGGVETAPTRPTFKQQQAEAVAQPFVQKAMELFNVDPSRVRVTPPSPTT
jgi:hypothetical protein